MTQFSHPTLVRFQYISLQDYFAFMKPLFTYFIRNKKTIFHIVAWVLFFLMPVIFSDEGGSGRKTWDIRLNLFYLNAITKVFWIILFYLNTTLLIPRVFNQKKWIPFVLAQLSLFAIILVFNRIFFGLLVTEFKFSVFTALFYHGIPFLFVVLGSIVYTTIRDRIASEKAETEKQKENLKTELAFLRSQISPHFLFNVLNNIVALVRLNSDKLEPTILKLSTLLQYMLYETDEEKVILKSEIDYLQSYIDLQKLRFGDRLTITRDLQIKEDWHAIEPMLLIPFVENAFKHGTGMIEEPLIEISLETYERQLIFKVKNKYLKDDNAKDKSSGIGLANVKRRLELLYHENHSLTIDKTDLWFTVILKLTLEQ
jgi:sensor histidine kinase YesM